MNKDDLKCRVPGCRVRIKGMTGYQEIEKLIKHMRRCHEVTWDLQQALAWRERWEQEERDANL